MNGRLFQDEARSFKSRITLRLSDNSFKNGVSMTLDEVMHEVNENYLNTLKDGDMENLIDQAIARLIITKSQKQYQL